MLGGYGNKKRNLSSNNMLSTAKQAGATAHETVRSHPFFRVNGMPTRKDYDTLKEEASALACKEEDITYPWSKNAT